MTYRRPEVSVLGDVAGAIRNLLVKDPTAMIPETTFPFSAVQPAYDLDE